MTNEQKLELKLKESYLREERLEEELRELRRKKFISFAEEECWIFQEGGENYLDSLCCPVVISPERLIEMRCLLDIICKTEHIGSNALFKKVERSKRMLG